MATNHQKRCTFCVPSIKYKCMRHRPKNQCIGCLRTNQKLYASGIGILCRDCQVKNGVIFG